MRTVVITLILSVGCIGIVSAASVFVESDKPEENRLYDGRPYSIEFMAKRAALPYSGGIYGKRAAALPYSGGIYGKRAALPYSGGIYGKRASVPFSGGIYGKRSSDDIPLDHVNGISIRAMPINGGFYG
ncbi:unnamed protein product [Bursaphelenchus okinawaensis]|uniref:Uncharacterized protein n=1 Tax=Bursaphelenchus okinawaensis TaxID=465554 RepID=A0A811KK45_9BILA|nr:unnamed protein product [Bursaphelenchus okinawaensis]CAG9104900.1 unnamed protein product [Bursaphelenchus okinawaensis]